MSIKVKVEILDDMKILADNLAAKVLKNENVEEVFVEYNGEDGLTSILNNSPDIIFTDNQMPKKTGMELIEELKYYTFEQKPKIVLVTGDSDPSIYQKARELNFEVVPKPISDDIINMIIKEVVDGQVTDYIEKNKVETKTACKKKRFFSKLFN